MATMKKPSWAIRVTFADGRTAFIRISGTTGPGPMWTFYSKADAEAKADELRAGIWPWESVTVIQRSHGRNVSPSPGQETSQ